MKVQEKISTDTKAFIGFKFEAKGTNYTKLVCAKSRYYDITVENDLFNIRAYTLRGVKELNVLTCEGVFVDGLSDALLLMAIK